MSYSLGAGTGSPTAVIKIAATAADVPEGATGWIVLADAILPGYVPPAGRAVGFYGDEGGYTQAVIMTTAMPPVGTYADWYAAYFDAPFAIGVEAELVSVAIGGNGETIATVTDSAAARATALLHLGGSGFSVQLTMATSGKYLADLTAGSVTATILAVTYDPSL